MSYDWCINHNEYMRYTHSWQAKCIRKRDNFQIYPSTQFANHLQGYTLHSRWFHALWSRILSTSCDCCSSTKECKIYMHKRACKAHPLRKMNEKNNSWNMNSNENVWIRSAAHCRMCSECFAYIPSTLQPYARIHTQKPASSSNLRLHRLYLGCWFSFRKRKIKITF